MVSKILLNDQIYRLISEINCYVFMLKKRHKQQEDKKV